MDHLGKACLVLGFAYLCSGLVLALPFPRRSKPPQQSPETEEPRHESRGAL
jgi:hypothetical protein